jgi:hypothetical protein
MSVGAFLGYIFAWCTRKQPHNEGSICPGPTFPGNMPLAKEIPGMILSMILQRPSFIEQDSKAPLTIRINTEAFSGPKMASKFEKHHVPQFGHPPYSPDISPCDFWLFKMLRKVLKVASLTRATKLKRRLRRSGMSSLPMKCRASFTTGWAVLHGLSRMGERILLNKSEITSLHAVNLKIGESWELSLQPVALSMIA